jgi:hypothetical protein
MHQDSMIQLYEMIGWTYDYEIANSFALNKSNKNQINYRRV